jgi:hypothetical protein
MPRDRRSVSFGTATPVPSGLIGQLLFLFRRKQDNAEQTAKGDLGETALASPSV